MSKPIEHSPGPWREDQYNYDLDHWQKGVAWCIRDSEGRVVIEGNPHSGDPLDGNGKLIAAAPQMYHILKQIWSEDVKASWEAMRLAKLLFRELEDETNAES